MGRLFLGDACRTATLKAVTGWGIVGGVLPPRA
jgi:hypothetical protein